MTAPALPERTPIPSPLVSSGKGRAHIKCPDCERTWPSTSAHRPGALARYELHWRLSHDVRRAI